MVISGIVPVPNSNAGAVTKARTVERAGANALLLLDTSWFTCGIHMLPEGVEAYVMEIAYAMSIPVLYFVARDYTGSIRRNLGKVFVRSIISSAFDHQQTKACVGWQC